MSTGGVRQKSTAKQMALLLWDAGYEIFPIPPGCKTTAGSGIRWRAEWEENRFRNREQVVAFWTGHPDWNIGIECGKSALFVIDLDGEEAAEAFARLWRECEGACDYGCPIIKTRRGWHLWFTMPAEPLRNTESLLLDGVDTRGDGGMVVAPGSTVFYDSDGDRVPPFTYELLVSDGLAYPRELPRWLEQRLRAFQPRITCAPVDPWPPSYAQIMLDQVPKRMATALPGRRNRALHKAAFRLRPAVPALGPEVVEAALWAAAEENGLAGEEPGNTMATIRSGLGG